MKSLGASDDIIRNTEQQMGIQFPEGLKEVWRVSNGLELPGGWRLFPVFDPGEPRKTCSHIGYENTRGRWSYMDSSLITIAGGDTGNHLVLQCQGNVLGNDILLWDHETNKTRKWGKDWDYLISKAQSRIAKIEKQISRSLRRKGKTAQQPAPGDAQKPRA